MLTLMLPTASMSVMTEPQATNDNTFIIVGAAIEGCVLIAILIMIIILTIVCFKLYPSTGLEFDKLRACKRKKYLPYVQG